jgi:hypothetical protein
MLVRMWGKGTLIHTWWEMKTSTTTMENSMEAPQGTKNKTAI